MAHVGGATVRAGARRARTVRRERGDTMTGPRYKVAVVHGYRTLKTGNPGTPPGLAAHVLDRLDAHRCVATFRSEDKRGRAHGHDRQGGGGNLGRAGAIAAATAHADEWNAD